MADNETTPKPEHIPDPGVALTGVDEKPGFSVKDFGYRLWRTVFRHRFDGTGLSKAQIIFTSFFLHIQPVKVHKRSLKFKTTGGLGLITLYLFLILAVTGILIMFHYIPSSDTSAAGYPVAYECMLNLRSNVFWGRFIRNLHRWCAHAMVVAVFMHMARVFFTGAYKEPRQFNWLIGFALAMMTLLLSYTGYLLPWDQLAFWGVNVGTQVAKAAPGGDILRPLLLGDNAVGQQALLRFYVLHVVVLPGGLATFIGIHLWRVRKDGGLARPADTSGETMIPAAECGCAKNNSVYNNARSYKLVEVVKGVEPKVDEEVNQMVFTWPKMIVREMIILLGTLAVMCLIAYLFNAPLEEPANPAVTPNPAKAPWYFLGLQEMLAYHTFIGGVLIPGILASFMMFYPYIEMGVEAVFGIKDRGGVGVWFARSRWLENLIFLSIAVTMIVLIIIGVYFRGHNWAFVNPFIEAAKGGGH